MHDLSDYLTMLVEEHGHGSQLRVRDGSVELFVRGASIPVPHLCVERVESEGEIAHRFVYTPTGEAVESPYASADYFVPPRLLLTLVSGSLEPTDDGGSVVQSASGPAATLCPGLTRRVTRAREITSSPSPSVVATPPVAVLRRPRPRGAGRPRAQRRTSSRSGSSDDGSGLADQDEGDGEPPPPDPPQLFLLDPGLGRINRAFVRWLREHGR